MATRGRPSARKAAEGTSADLDTRPQGAAAAAAAVAAAAAAPTFRTRLLRYFRTEGRLTRLDVSQRTEWSRVTVTARIQQLLDEGLLVESTTRATSGRPAVTYGLNADRACIAVAAFGLTGVYVAWCDLAGKVRQSDTATLETGLGPEEMLAVAREKLLALPGLDPTRVWGLAFGVPAPVEHGTGRVVEPPMLQSWDDVRLRDLTRSWFDSDVIVENDANALAYGEFVAAGENVRDLFFIKVSTGIGSGIITNGQLVRGALGAAGDLGHTCADRDLFDGGPRTCECGRLDCLEIYAAGWGMARTLGETSGVSGLLRRLENNDLSVRAAMDQAGRIIGAAAAGAVSLLNPGLVVLGGQLAVHPLGRRMVRNITDEIEDRALGMVTDGLEIRVSSLGDEASAIGLARLFADRIFEDDKRLDQLIATR